MRDLKIHVIWQWVADTHYSVGSTDTTDTIRSRSFTCTPNGDAPKYLPNSPEDVKACTVG
jgi:hypothetical protein